MYVNDRFKRVAFETFRSDPTSLPKIEFKLREKVSHWSSAQGQDFFVQTVLDSMHVIFLYLVSSALAEMT